MNVQLLVDAIVRQTTVLLAQLATAGGARAPLAHVANRVFLDLAEELQRQGLGRKVSADMFGMALRTYLRKIQRLKESATDAGSSLWEAVLDFLVQHDRVVSRAEILQRFRQDEPEVVGGILRDLCESRLVFRMGAGPHTAFRAATEQELGAASRQGCDTTDDAMIWAIVYRHGPLTRGAAARLAPCEALDSVLERLQAEGLVQKDDTAPEPLYSARQFGVARGAEAGWEAAVYDHYHAVVKTICANLATDPSPTLGGSTYSFEVWAGHPCESEVLGQLEAFRRHTSELRARVRAFNESHERPNNVTSVTVYAGQCTLREEKERFDVEEA